MSALLTETADYDPGCGVKGFDTVREVQAGTSKSSVIEKAAAAAWKETKNMPWQHSEDLPSDAGVYVRDCRSIPSPSVLTELFCKFDGDHWYQGRWTPTEAMACTARSDYARLPWR